MLENVTVACGRCSVARTCGGSGTGASSILVSQYAHCSFFMIKIINWEAFSLCDYTRHCIGERARSN